MKLSTFTDYSLRMLMMLAVEPQRRTTVAEIAAAFGISEHHLSKVAHGLGRHGWLATVRGQGGGLTLAMPAKQIVIGEVVRCTENGDLPAACFADDSPACAIGPACRLHDVLDEALQAFYRVLDRYTLADLVHDPRVLSRLLYARVSAG
jgi:Rrf2 family nitric oxide-sensitive transcriptional repressor